MAQKFKVGDIVQLKSGGPRMTVDAVAPTIDGPVYAAWFAGSKHNRERFAVDSIMLAPPDEEEK